MKKHNFYAGPSVLNRGVIENTANAVLNFANMDLSLLEISHRSKQFQAVMDDAVATFKELLDIPEGYEVLFLGGGASLQFYMAPLNLMGKKAAYLNTGTWSTNAIKQAGYVDKVFGTKTIVVASSEDKNFTYIPKGFEIPEDVDYFHYTSNNTIYGTEIRKDFDCKVPLVCDMSSDIFSRPIDVSKYDCIYGGAQKNMGPAGATFVVIRKDALGKFERPIPTMLDYQTHVKKGSMFNTPPVLPIYTCLQTMKWYKEMGGVKVMEQRAKEKADLLYTEIDRNKLFRGTVATEDRSRMNVCFVLNDEYAELQGDFYNFATERGMVGIKGHRSVGGFRASLYNGLEMESVQALVQAMQDFEKKH